MSLCYPVCFRSLPLLSFFFNATATTEIYTLSLHDALPISNRMGASSPCRLRAARHHRRSLPCAPQPRAAACSSRSEEHTSELQSLRHLVCRLLLEKKKMSSYLIAMQWKVSIKREADIVGVI